MSICYHSIASGCESYLAIFTKAKPSVKILEIILVQSFKFDGDFTHLSPLDGFEQN